MMPRTGSRFIGSLLRDSLSGRIEIIEHIQPPSGGFKVPGLGKEHIWRFCFVRDPYSRFISSYRWIMRPRPRNKYDRRARSAILKYRDIRQFCLNLDNFISTPDNCPIHFYPQSWWITDSDGRLTMDYIGRFESLDESWLDITTKLGISYQPISELNKQDFSWRKKASRRVFNLYHWWRSLLNKGLYNKEVREIVIDFYQRDYDLFGYSSE